MLLVSFPGWIGLGCANRSCTHFCFAFGEHTFCFHPWGIDTLCVFVRTPIESRFLYCRGDYNASANCSLLPRSFNVSLMWKARSTYTPRWAINLRPFLMVQSVFLFLSHSTQNKKNLMLAQIKNQADNFNWVHIICFYGFSYLFISKMPLVHRYVFSCSKTVCKFSHL
jgi:hypothetical protein